MQDTDIQTGLPTDDITANINPSPATPASQPAPVANSAPGVPLPTAATSSVSEVPRTYITSDIPATTYIPEPASKKPAPITIVDSAPLPELPAEKKQEIPVDDLYSGDRLPNFNEIEGAETNPLLQSKIEDSPIFNKDVTVTQKNWDAVSSAMLYPSFFIEDKLGSAALKYAPSKTIAMAETWLSADKTPEYYQAIADKEKAKYSSSSSAASNPFIDYASLPQAEKGKGNSTIRTGTNGEIDYKASLLTTISNKESKNNYTVINSLSGALGKYQVMPDSLAEWSETILGRVVKPEEFLASKEIQEQIATSKLGEFYDRGIKNGLSKDDAVQYASTSWYGGENSGRIVDKKINFLPKDLIKQGEYPSIKEYAQSIVSNFKVPNTKPADTPKFDTSQARTADSISVLKSVKKFYDTYKDKVISNPEGTYAGECVSLARNYYDNVMGVKVPVYGNAGDGLTDSRLDNAFTAITKNFTPKINDMFFMNAKKGIPYGHTGIVVGNPLKDGTVMIMEANWANDQTPSLRQIPVSDIDGVRRLKT